MDRQKNNPPGLPERLKGIKTRIGAAARRAGRAPEEVGLIAVTKTHPAQSIEPLFELGQSAFGENRVQEALEKMEALAGRGEWHLIGHLQRNKAALAAGRFALIHSVDSVRLIEELEKQAAKRNVVQSILLEINIAGETEKTGAAPDELAGMLQSLSMAPHLSAEGLMTMAPYDPDPEKARPHFARLRELLRAIGTRPGFTPRHLSMGMSGDFEVAIEEGATLVRIGTAIMGER